MELKGLRVNIGKTKVMRRQVRIGQAEDSGKYPCGVCREGVGDNSIKCVACHKWVHKRCSGISGRLRYDADFRCRSDGVTVKTPRPKGWVASASACGQKVCLDSYLG